jgi:predicted DNA-binding ribbon-helix-helix protein
MGGVQANCGDGSGSPPPAGYAHAPPSETLVPPINPAKPPAVEKASTPQFRVISQGKVKRGIRLEHVFWQAAKKIAQRRQLTIGGFFDAVSAQDPDATNLASAIRVACVSWMADRTTELENITSLSVLGSILAAVPSPAVVLGPERKILASNKAFQLFVRRHLSIPSPADPKDVRLVPDIGVPEIVARLEQNGNAAVLSGFSLTVADRRIRGQLNAVRAPLSEPGTIIGFVVL